MTYLPHPESDLFSSFEHASADRLLLLRDPSSMYDTTQTQPPLLGGPSSMFDTTGTQAPREAPSAEVRIGYLLPLIIIVLCISLGACWSPRTQVRPAEAQVTEQQEPERRIKEDSSTRRKKILKSFDANQVTMIVNQDHIRSSGSVTDRDLSNSSIESDTKKPGEKPNKMCRLEGQMTKPSSGDIEEGSRQKTDDDPAAISDKETPAAIDAVATMTLESNATTNVLCTTETGDDEDGILLLPYRVDSQSHEVSNLCAICLDSYHPGDAVVWSNNPNCCHVFHTDCMVHYLVKVKSGDTPCPTCRQTFTVLEMKDESLPTGDENC